MSTASSVIRESVGSLTRHIITFSSLATSDTYASGIPGVVCYWLQITSASAANVSSGCGFSISESAGTFTFTGGGSEAGNAVGAKLMVESKS